ncbi:cytosine permease [Galbibacter sp. PAP.153]|uniref:cytosine permease n=1 Tax=Galbibacter sp. PAP.153 TaxID=3104623 RepID=UPI0030086DBF
MEENQRNAKWFSLASIWFGGIVSVPSLLIGSSLITILPFKSTLVAGLVGFSIVVVLMALISMVAVDRQFNSVQISEGSFGQLGSKLIVGIVIAVSTLGWFGVQTNIAGDSFSKIMMESFGIHLVSWVSSIFWGVIMIMTAVFGFKYLKWLNYVAVPAIMALLLYAAIITFQSHGLQEVLDYRPEESISIIQGIGLAIGFISVTIVISPDYNRFAASKKDAVLGSLMGILPSALPLMALGAILAITRGTYDVVEIFSSLGFPLFAMMILILATWTSNVVNIYSSGLAFNTLLNLPEKSRARTTLIAGSVGLLLAAIGIINYFMGFISFLTVTVTPIVGVIVSHYYLGRSTDTANDKSFNWKGIVSWLIGVLSMLLITNDTKYIIGILVSSVLFFLFTRIPDKMKSNN